MGIISVLERKMFVRIDSTRYCNNLVKTCYLDKNIEYFYVCTEINSVEKLIPNAVEESIIVIVSNWSQSVSIPIVNTLVSV